MGGRAGGGAGMGSMSRGGGMTRSDIIAKFPELMTKVKDSAVRDDLVQAIQEMQKEYGVTPDTLKFVNRKNNEAGSQSGDGTTTINLKYLGDHAASQKIYAGTFHPQGSERNPAKATLVHELAHKIEFANGRYGSKMSKELDAAYKSFISGWRQGTKNNPAAHSVGGYATYNKSEYFAEALSGYHAGLKNKYTMAAYKIAKKYSK